MPFIDELARKTNARIMVLLMHWEAPRRGHRRLYGRRMVGGSLRTFIDKLPHTGI
ncbi:MAG: hypothetical protein ACLTAO_00310 [Christensenellales bacterium]